ALAYALAVALFAAGIATVLYFGKGLELAPGAAAAPRPEAGLLSRLHENAADPLSRLLLPVIVIIIPPRSGGWALQRLGQPAVIGEIAAGILLGPSLLGWVWPDAAEFVFPAASLGTLGLLAQIGVCVFMFVVGLELEIALLRKKAHAAI